MVQRKEKGKGKERRREWGGCLGWMMQCDEPVGFFLNLRSFVCCFPFTASFYLILVNTAR